MGTIVALRSLFRGSARARIAWILVGIHAAWFFLAIANMSAPNPAFGWLLDASGPWTTSLLAGRPFHFSYESLSLKLLFVLDLPALIAAIPIAIVGDVLLTALHVGSYAGSYFGAAIWLLVSSCQWLAIGGLLQARRNSRPARSTNA
jgi:hypothetical protein